MLNRVLFGLAVASVLMLLAGGLNYIWRVVRGRSVGVRPTVLVLISAGLSLLDAAILEAVANPSRLRDLTFGLCLLTGTIAIVLLAELIVRRGRIGRRGRLMVLAVLVVGATFATANWTYLNSQPMSYWTGTYLLVLGSTLLLTDVALRIFVRLRPEAARHLLDQWSSAVPNESAARTWRKVTGYFAITGLLTMGGGAAIRGFGEAALHLQDLTLAAWSAGVGGLCLLALAILTIIRTRFAHSWIRDWYLYLAAILGLITGAAAVVWVLGYLSARQLP